ncbi:DNA topoisomerase II [Pyrus ussuriensis x Pyrus communis]|uniref:DNA topoisomerase II n=1 Tax=Pyrus ussuriensis x Pyrus communis TaxID=2448454 RepID=A0A5N5GGY2_9ROSA|nr:DNA topoisomerase II [Pyrus ussuriensis x Pyrus communis]
MRREWHDHFVGRKKADLIDELTKKRVISRNKDYAFLTSVRFDTFTIEGRDALGEDYVEAKAELDKLDVETAKSLWLKDLEALEAELRTHRGNGMLKPPLCILECWELVLMYWNYRVYYMD